MNTNGQIRKIIVISKCDECPFYRSCSAWKSLTGEQRTILILGVGIGDFILKNCELDNEIKEGIRV